MGIAGLWTSNRKATGAEVLSFTMLTINADGHGLFSQFHKPQDEKRMPPHEGSGYLTTQHVGSTAPGKPDHTWI